MHDDSMAVMGDDASLFLSNEMGGAEWAAMDASIFNYDPTTAWSPWDDAGQPLVVGDPLGDAGAWTEQTTDFTCAVVAQRGVLESFGVDVSEAQLVYDATVNGWLTNDGTSPDNLGSLLEHYGVPTHSVTGASLDDLVAELAQGHKVLVGVDGGELAGSDSPLEDWVSGEQADHAVHVTGVIRDESGQVWVTVNDSGVADGQAATHTWEDFADAWADGGNHYVATSIAPGEVLPEGGALAASAETVAPTPGDETRLGGIGESLRDFPIGENTSKVFGASVAMAFGLPPGPAVAVGVGWSKVAEIIRDNIAQTI